MSAESELSAAERTAKTTAVECPHVVIGVLTERLATFRELLEEVYDSTVPAGTYPDGPCIHRELRGRVGQAICKK